MKKMPFDSSLSKTKGRVILEYIALALCLCVIALRATYTEGPVAQSIIPVNLSDNLYTLSVSAVLFLSFIFWFIYGFCSKRFLYRFTAIEIGLCLFCIAVVSACFAASNKRIAITDAICLITPVLMAVLLVQILDSQPKIKLVLAVIAALGVVSAYQCAEQFFVSNQAMIAQYKESPSAILEPLGIESGSFQQFLFEHRLYSKDVRGFFTTGNSTGSFAILAFFAALALFIDKFKCRKASASGNRPGLLPLITCGAAVAVVFFGLIITHSKGAIAASLIAASLFVVFLYIGNWLKMHRKTVFFVCLLFFIAISCAVVVYGLTHNRLPGGKSMLVRWQYWLAAAKMYADHPLTGVGPGNFAHFYTHYKPAAALESVADPHNFLLSILTQYGPLGLIGFLALFFIPLWRTIPSSSIEHQASSIEYRQADHQPSFRPLAITYLIIISAALLLIRPLIIRTPLGNTFEVAMYLIFTLYVAPVTAFAVGFWLLTTDTKPRVTSHESRDTYIPAALFCAVLGLLLHNLIDFAIFEPPVFTAFCAIVACLIASDFQQNSRPSFAIKSPLPIRIILAASGLLLIWGYFNYVLAPVAKTSVRNRQAVQQGQSFEYAHQLLYQAAEQDPLDPTALNLNGKLYLLQYNKTLNAQLALLKKAEYCFFAAIARDNADFKNYEKLSEVYSLLAKNSPAQEKTDLLNKSLNCLWSAVERYPTSDRLRFELAEVAEQLGKTDIAVAQYEKAVVIENAYRNQFKIMYPGREIFSRLGEEKYEKAKQRIKSLSERPSP
jgi:O-antigen ligase/tetratricopeptide (TPR) repeat protein